MSHCTSPIQMDRSENKMKCTLINILRLQNNKRTRSTDCIQQTAAFNRPARLVVGLNEGGNGFKTWRNL